MRDRLTAQITLNSPHGRAAPSTRCVPRHRGSVRPHVLCSQAWDGNSAQICSRRFPARAEGAGTQRGCAKEPHGIESNAGSGMREKGTIGGRGCACWRARLNLTLFLGSGFSEAIRPNSQKNTNLGTGTASFKIANSKSVGW